MGLADSRRQAFRSRRRHQEVNVIRHQAIAEDLNSMEVTPVPEIPLIARIIGFVEECLLPPIAPLSNVVRDSRYDNPGETRHIFSRREASMESGP